MMRPTAVEPVNVTARTAGAPISCSETGGGSPKTRLTAPGGAPASASARTTSAAVRGVASAALSTAVQPAARIAPSLRAASTAGKFQAVNAATTPSGAGSRQPLRARRAARDHAALDPPGLLAVPAQRLDRAADLAARLGRRSCRPRRASVAATSSARSREQRGGALEDRAALVRPGVAAQRGERAPAAAASASSHVARVGERDRAGRPRRSPGRRSSQPSRRRPSRHAPPMNSRTSSVSGHSWRR